MSPGFVLVRRSRVVLSLYLHSTATPAPNTSLSFSSASSNPIWSFFSQQPTSEESLVRPPAMEVTRSNFASALPEIQEAIEAATFIAIDGEFTGLNVGGMRSNPFDTFQDRYERQANIARNFQLIQFGLCAFKYDEDKKRFDARAYNFYLWPETSVNFLVQSDSLKFLASHNFNFNKLINEGIPYLKPTEIEKRALRSQNWLQQEEERAKGRTKKSKMHSPGPIHHQEEMANLRIQIKQKLINGKENEVRLKKLNAKKRQDVMDVVYHDFKGVVREKLISGSPAPDCRGVRDLCLVRADSAEISAINRTVEDERLATEAGFTLIIQRIIERRVPILGHNIWLDLCFVLNQFVAPLPSDVHEFLQLVRASFDTIIDTKVLAGTFRLSSLSLERLVDHVGTEVNGFFPPEIHFPEKNCDLSAADGAYHDAAYDAYATGRCFIALASRQFCNETFSVLEGKGILSDAKGRPAVLPHHLPDVANKIHLSRKYPDQTVLDLGNDPTEADYRRVFHVDGLNKAERLEEILGPSVTLGRDKHFSSSVDEELSTFRGEAIFEVLEPPMSAMQVKELVQKCRPGLFCQTYAEYKAQVARRVLLEGTVCDISRNDSSLNMTDYPAATPPHVTKRQYHTATPKQPVALDLDKVKPVTAKKTALTPGFEEIGFVSTPKVAKKRKESCSVDDSESQDDEAFGISALDSPGTVVVVRPGGTKRSKSVNEASEKLFETDENW